MRTDRLKLNMLILLALSFLTFQINAQEIVKGVGNFTPVAQMGNAINPNPVQGSSTALITGPDTGTNSVFKIPIGNYAGQTVYAGTFTGTVDADATNFYCVDINNGLKYNEEYEDDGHTSAEITYILNNYYPYANASGALSDSEEAAAVQIALWHFSDGATVDNNSVSDETIRNRALAIIADANANAGSTVVPSTITIAPAYKLYGTGDEAVFVVKVTDVNGNPVSNVSVSLSSTSGTLSDNTVTTDANGEAAFTLQQTNDDFATVTAEATATIPQGTRYIHKAHPNTTQKLVLATPVTATASAEADVAWADGEDYCITLDDGSIFTIGTLYTYTLPNGDVSVRLEISNDYNDNTYQENNNDGYTIGWPGGNHKFKHLTGSDKAEFELFDANNNSVIHFDLDYIESGKKQPNSYPSGYGPRIENIYSGDANYIVDMNSSLSRNFNDFGYVLDGENGHPDHSPLTDANYTPNPSYPYWDFNMVYEFTVDGAAFGNAGFGSVDVVSLHNSPNKLGTDNQTFPDPCVTTTPGSLGDKVWEDSNGNGIQDGNESGLANVTVELYDCNNTFIASTTTDNNGNYFFSNLTPGDYTVKFIAPSGYVITTQYAGNDDAVDSDANENDGKTDCITIASGEDNQDVDAGMFQPKFKIGDFVWHDKDVDGIQDAGEPGIENVKVNLIKNNNVIATTTTDANGYYEFDNLFAGSYEVEIDASNFTSNGVLKNVADEKWYASPKNQGGDDAVDSDGDETTHKVSVILTNADDLTVDFGFFKTSFTFDKSGPQSVNAGEVITYTFTVVNTGDLVLHGGVTIYDALINPNGNHQIWNGVVNPGETKTITKTYTTTANDCGDLVNNATAVGHPVLGNTSYPNIETSDSWTTTVVCQKGSIGDKVWNDTDHDGIQDNGEVGIDGVTVKLLDSNGSTLQTTTTANGGLYKFNNIDHGTYYVEFSLPANYVFSPKGSGNDNAVDSDVNISTGKTDAITLAPGQDITTVDAGMYDNRKASLGDYVWVDDNSNGKQDQGESGIGGVTVNLYDDNDQLIGTKVTANDGSYLFDQLDAGTYYVKFILPNGFLFTVPNVNGNNDDLIDSDVDVTTGKTGNYTLSAGDNETTVDAGLIDNRPASIGDFVWNDANGNGIQESGEFGVGNITVYLLDSNGDTVQTTTTNGSGNYQFANVAPGTYTVEFDIPSNYAISPKHSGNDDAIDSDINPDGKTDPITVNHGDNITTIDAGIKEIPLQPATIGDFVWNDLDHDGVQDNGETGYTGVTVKLFTCAGDYKDVTTTDANGHYSFTIPANELGDYYVEFDLPQGYMFSPKDNASGNNADEIDSDADANGKTDCITINSGSTNDTWDAGIYEIPLTADLSITKSVSDANPNDGDQITYTINVTNHGPADATGVEVTDILPGGLVFVSATASAGNYVDSTGIWTIGSIAANNTVVLEVTATVDVQDCITGTIDLGPATGFNLFVWRDFKAPSSDVEGKVAVGRDAELSNYSIADKLNGSYAGQDVFIVNRDLYFTSGRVYYGNATYGRATNLPKQNVTIDGSLRKDRPVDFAAAKAYLKNLSTTLSNYAVNGTTTYQWSGVFLEGNDPYLNVFDVSGTELTNSTYMDIKVPNGAVVLINVDGRTITWNGGLTVTGTSITNVLYNFHKARTLNINGIDVRGSVLAPFANVNFNSGLISGQLIAKSMFGTGQINNYPFVGNVPCPTEIVNVAEISAADQGDPDSTPGNGDNTEDDYASVTINIGTTNGGGGNGGGNGGGSGSGDNGTWDVASQFPFQEIVWTMANDLQGNMLAGTVGGHLYISYDDGDNWTHINENLIVGFIWDIAVHPTTGAIAIGTEQGVFYTTNDGASWNGPVLTGDVRALVFDAAGNAYAGVWGLGVFKSTNNGQTWSAASDGLSPYGLAVQSLAIDGNGDLYAGTFGGGVYKSTDAGTSWDMLNVGYPFVWSVAVDSHSNVYAATYGAGVYKSGDAGDNWYEYNNGLDAAFVYSVIVDANDNVYAATWLGGIYMLTNAPTPTAGDDNVAGTSWTPLGLGGVGISSLLVNPANGNLYAGSNDGAVYVQASSLTGVNDELEIPKEFTLEQNYPNPFNPSTTIKFGVPKAGEYTLNIYNVIGQLVTTLAKGEFQAGWHEVQFNANNLSSGIYIYRFQGNNVVITKKMILMK